MDTKFLKPKTAQIWNSIQDNSLLRDFVLIGGTALSMHIGHRISEDLDFAYVANSKHLPKKRIDLLVKEITEAGYIVEKNPNAIEAEEFFDSGLDLDNYQQDYVVDSDVKISFVCFDPPMDQLIAKSDDINLRVATLGEIFSTKAFVCSERAKSRDWLDLYVLLNEHDYTIRDFYNVFDSVCRLNSFAIAKSRLINCKPSAHDEGYSMLMQHAPSIDEMRSFFRSELNELEKILSIEKYGRHK